MTQPSLHLCPYHGSFDAGCAVCRLVPDAERYRWIRRHGAWETEAMLNNITPEEYDRLLDRAMAMDP